MSAYDFYINPDEYKIAESNGISNTTLDRRIRDLGWDKKRAISEPIRKPNNPEMIELARHNGIPYNTFYVRVHKYGYSPEKAATHPVSERKEIMRKAQKHRRRKYPIKYVKQAEENGVSYNTFYNRIRLGWSMKAAATTPVLSKKRSKGA